MTQDEQGYNGWKNYETWCVSLWLSNEQGTDEDVRRIATYYASQAEQDDQGRWIVDERTLSGVVADAVKDYVEELPEYAAVAETASFVSDLLRAALSEVDWYEIADNLLSDVDMPTAEDVDA